MKKFKVTSAFINPQTVYLLNGEKHTFNGKGSTVDVSEDSAKEFERKDGFLVESTK